ncbi:MAG: hypothetical protein J5843_03175 [Clostridia bacterium]|nr:hypothetical protein [Clostridia bacterium]
MANVREAEAAILKTKYPLLLVPGAIIRKFLFLRPFGRIDRELRRMGYDARVVKVDGVGTVENNAAMLKEQLAEIVRKDGCGKVNLIAYSKGGLDARYLIESLGGSHLVASLTTLCTPHRGSPIASGFLDLPRWMVRFFCWNMNVLYKIAGDRHPDALAACRQIADKEDRGPVPGPVSGVLCRSFSATRRKKGAGTEECETDGFVSHASAAYGEYCGVCIEGSVGHLDLVDFWAGRKTRKKVIDFYAKLCAELAERGL